MAIKPTIYKFSIILSDLNRNYYDTLNLTVAQHPSESLERMMARVLALCINAEDGIAFTRGLSDPDLPDIWLRSLDDQISLWIDVGEPAAERIKKAVRVCERLMIYSFNSKSAVWWQQSQAKFARLPVAVYQFDNAGIVTLASLVERGLQCSITITGNSAFVAADAGQCDVEWSVLQDFQS